jgi:hypothetical protein
LGFLLGHPYDVIPGGGSILELGEEVVEGLG